MLQISERHGLAAAFEHNFGAMRRFAEKLDAEMRSRGLNPSRLSEQLGGAPSNDTIGRWLKGKAGGAKLEDVLKVASHLGLPINYLCDDALDRPPGEDLTEDERVVLRIAREIGPDRAIRRLVDPPEVRVIDPQRGPLPPVRR
jgi:transcriptional regulator with XRE-family HTH domain